MPKSAPDGLEWVHTHVSPGLEALSLFDASNGSHPFSFHINCELEAKKLVVTLNRFNLRPEKLFYGPIQPERQD